MKILFISPYSHFGAISGSVVRLKEVSRELVGLGCHVVFLGHPSIAKHLDSRIELQFLSLEGSFREKLLSVQEMAKLCKAIDPDVVISESPLLPRMARLVFKVHLIHDAKFAGHNRRRFGMIAWICHAYSSMRADTVMTVSKAEGERLSRVLPVRKARIMISKNGLADAFLTRPRSSKVKKYDILYVSNFAKHKRHDFVVDLAARHGWKCAFVGADLGEKESLQKRISMCNLSVDFFEGLSTGELIGLYDCSRVFIFPSEIEGFGIPFLEARARGLPVVASDIPVFKQLASEIGASLVGGYDEDDWIEAIDHALGQRCVRDAEIARLEKYLWSNIAVDMLNEVKRRVAGLPKDTI
jgi:glycosyltransferase involved in cell wall biosynthesis